MFRWTMPRYEGYPLMHVHTKSFYSNSLFSLESDLKLRVDLDLLTF